MSSLNPFLRKRYKNNNYGIINVTIPDGKGKYKIVSTGVKVQTKDWLEKSGKISSTVANHIELNNKIKNKISQIQENLESESKIKKMSSNDSYLDFFKTRLNYLERTQIGTYRKYNTVLNHLNDFKNYLEVDDIKFSDIDYEMVLKLVEYFEFDDVRARNTINNYIKTCKAVYNLAIYREIYKSYSNPFSKYKIKNEKIRRDVLEKNHIKELTREQFPKDGIEEKAYHLFMIQIYGYGLRVSDLFLMRKSYIKFNKKESRIEFIQFKSTKPHSVLLSAKLLRHLYFFIDKDSYKEDFFGKIYPEIDSDELYSYQDLRRKKTSAFAIHGKESEEFKVASEKKFKLELGIYFDQLQRLKSLFLKEADDFILPIMNSNLFKNVNFNGKVKLNKKQYYNLMSKVATYNKELKLLIPFTGSTTNLTTHTARHSFSNMLLNDDVNLNSISKGLGHSSLSITESYLKSFKQEKIDDDISGSIGTLDLENF